MFDQAFIAEIAKQVAALVVAAMPPPATEATPWPRWMPVKVAAQYCGMTVDQFRYSILSKKLVAPAGNDRMLLIDREDLDRVLTKLKR